MSFRCVYTELNVSGQCNIIVILIDISISMTRYMAAAFLDIPSFKVMRIILNCVSHVNSIVLLCCSRICTERNFFFTQRDIILIKVCDPVAFEQHRIICDRFSFRYASIELCCGSFSDVSYRHRSCAVGVVLLCGPAFEINSIRKCSDTRIIEDLLHVVALLDEHIIDRLTICTAVRLYEFNQ